MTKFKEMLENTEINEGGVWDMIKGAGQVAIIIKNASKNMKKELDLLKNASDDDKIEGTLIAFGNLYKDVVKKVNGTSLDDDMKQSTITSFRTGLINGVYDELKAKNSEFDKNDIQKALR